MNNPIDRMSWRSTPWVKTVMPPSLPPEIFDHIIDYLCRERNTLKKCSIVSKSWVPRTRRHIFAQVDFMTRESIELWMKVFPDPSNSPAHHTRCIRIGAPAVTLMTSSGARAWVRSFHRVTKLWLSGDWKDGGFSEVVDFVCSFLLLEDLWLFFSASAGNVGDAWDTPLASPKLTGSLLLKRSGIGSIIPRLLRLPGGLHFTEVQVSCPVEETESVSDLVLRCSNTLESLQILFYPTRAFLSSPVLQ